MVTIVEQLQLDAADSDVPVVTLLRRARLAAAKLGLDSLEDWIEHELNGYPEDVAIPPYRLVKGNLIAFNPYRGWMPVAGAADTINRYSKTGTKQSIADLERMLDKGDDQIASVLSAEATNALNKLSNIPFPQYQIHIGRGPIVNILNVVRNAVLEWAINLEKAGILGREFSFSNDDKRAAREAIVPVTIGSIGSVVGNIGSGNVTGDVSVGNIDINEARGVAEQIRAQMSPLVEAGADRDKLSVALTSVEKELAKQQPDGGTLRELYNEVRTALTGAAGSFLAAGAITAITKIFGG